MQLEDYTNFIKRWYTNNGFNMIYINNKKVKHKQIFSVLIYFKDENDLLLKMAILDYNMKHLKRVKIYSILDICFDELKNAFKFAMSIYS